MNFKKNILSWTVGLAGSILMLTGCIHDDFDLNQNGKDQIKAPSLVFDVMVPRYSDENQGSSSPYIKEFEHGEEWEAFIDQGKFRVMFFDADGNYLFEIDPKFITLYEKGTMHDANQTPYDAYRVALPYEYLFPEGRDKTEPVFDKAVKDAVLENGFKIAVLANWPHYVEINRSIDFTGDETLDGELKDTKLDFEFDPTHTKPNSKLEHLSHCIDDGIYDGTVNEAYKHLPENNNQMGVFAPWVAYLYTSQRDAEDFIRAGYRENGELIEGDIQFTFGDNTGVGPNPVTNQAFDPNRPETYAFNAYGYSRKVDELNDYRLNNLWRVWNFSAGKTCPYWYRSDFGRTRNPQVDQYWSNRNTYTLIHQLNQIDWTNGNTFSINDGDQEALISSDNAGCKYVPVDGDQGGYLELPNVVSESEVEYLIRTSKTDNTAQANIRKFKESAVRIQGYGEGLLRISAKSDEEAKIYVLSTDPNGSSIVIDNLFEKNAQGRDFVNYNKWDFPIQGTEVKSVEFFIDPSKFPYRDVYIAAVGNNAQIYEIEYMRGRHLYDAARNAKVPSATNPIPMYGVQNFQAIGDFLTADHIFNMSDRSENRYLNDDVLDKYNFRFIYLLRSVAKVELRFKKSVFKNHVPDHVMMRGMNRTARCEPMDVINPTEWLWYGYGNEPKFNMNPFTGKYNSIPDYADPESFPGINGEFENIRNYGPLHGRGSNNYRNLSSWYYGIWTKQQQQPADGDEYFRAARESKWNFNGAATLEPETSTTRYPRIFNSRIDRSDFCRFHRVDDVVINGEEYMRFIMYVPEKNIDDADTRGDLTTTPKVQHIEVRFANVNTALNLDDRDCYSIYFTNYAENGARMRSYNRNGSNSFDDAIKDADFLRLLQPIVRNCHYIFTVNSINDEHIGVNLSICGAASRNASFTIK